MPERDVTGQDVPSLAPASAPDRAESDLRIGEALGYLDEMPPPEPDDRPARKCAHPRWLRNYSEGGWTCTCGHIAMAAKVRTGRLSRAKGNRIQRQRIVGLGGKNLAGNRPNHDGVGVMFSYESKAGGFFSERVWRVLRGIPATAQQTRVLLVTDTPGPGHRARSYVVVEYDEWRELHGETDTAEREAIRP